MAFSGLAIPVTGSMCCKPLPIFDAAVLQYQDKIPDEYVWPDSSNVDSCREEWLDIPTVDLSGFLEGDPAAMDAAARTVDKACREHGFFQVVEHGVEAELVNAAHRHMQLFFGLSLQEKQKAQRRIGESFGFSSSFTGRFSSKLPWKETLSLDFSPRSDVREYLEKTMGSLASESG